MLIDLHIHTVATPHHSTWDPDELAQYAAAHGIGVIAVADHNTTDQVRAVMAAGAQHGVAVVPGVELDTAFGGKLWHTLVYGVAPETPDLIDLCRAVVERNQRDAQALQAYAAQRGVALPWLDTLDRVPNVADVAHALVKAGVAPTQPGVEDEAAGMAFVLTELPDLYRPVGVDEAIAVAHAHGGVAVLAHPGRSKSVYAIPATADDVAAMVRAGLDGLEALYWSHTPEQQQLYSDLAQQHGLLVSAGSDSHHPAQGLHGRDAADCAALLERLGVQIG